MKALKLENPLVLKGENGINTFPAYIDNTANVTASISTEQNITTTGNVIFNQTTFNSNDSVNVSDSKWLIKKEGSTVNFIPTGSLIITGSLHAADNLTIPNNLSIPGKLSAKEIKTSNMSASIVFQSGSTKFGDTMDDIHPFTGSVNVTGNTMGVSLSKSNTNITAFSNETSPEIPSQTNPVTEYAARNLIAPFSGNQLYLRKCFAKVANSITNTTATFNAVTASVPRSTNSGLFIQLPETSENDFLFFKNGMIMESDAISIQQSGDTLTLTINQSEIGYELNSKDEIVAWGKFNS